jgi:peptidylprolyl isomerase
VPTEQPDFIRTAFTKAGVVQLRRPSEKAASGWLIQCRPRIDWRARMTQELIITDLVEGDGPAAVKGALITAHYTGWLADGATFDSSHDRGKPFQCVIGTGRVIKGWDIGLMGMKVGGKRKLWVPAHLAYGERQIGAHIKPNSDLTFDIELLEVLTRDD